MSNLQRFSNQFDGLYLREGIHGLGEYGASHTVEPSSQGFFFFSFYYFCNFYFLILMYFIFFKLEYFKYFRFFILKYFFTYLAALGLFSFIFIILNFYWDLLEC